MAQSTNMRREIQDLVQRLAGAGIPVDAIAHELIVTASGILIAGKGQEAAAAELEAAGAKIRASRPPAQH